MERDNCRLYTPRILRMHCFSCNATFLTETGIRLTKINAIAAESFLGYQFISMSNYFKNVNLSKVSVIVFFFLNKYFESEGRYLCIVIRTINASTWWCGRKTHRRTGRRRRSGRSLSRAYSWSSSILRRARASFSGTRSGTPTLLLTR